MKITFTGMKNASYIYDIDNKDKNIKTRFLSMQLTDDITGNDLTQYKQLISKNKEFQHPYYSNFINIASHTYHGQKVLQLNGKNIPETDEYLPLFSFIGKLTKKTANKPEIEFLTELGYLKSNFVDKALLLDKRISDEIRPFDKNFIEKLHEPEKIKKCAGKISKEVEQIMLEYLA